MKLPPLSSKYGRAKISPGHGISRNLSCPRSKRGKPALRLTFYFLIQIKGEGLSLSRFSRQILALGQEVHERLRDLRVAVIGCGALGSHLVEELGRMGVGRIRIVDPDIVEESNLTRTSLFMTKDLYKPKSLICGERVKEIYEEVQTETLVDLLTPDNALKLLDGVDVALDGLDDTYSRLLLNDAIISLGIPFVHGGVSSTSGSAMLIHPGKTACLSCFMEPEEGGNQCEVLGTTESLVAFTASLQVNLLTLYLMDNEDVMHSYLYYFDAFPPSLRKLRIYRRIDCPSCTLKLLPFLRGVYRPGVCSIQTTDHFSGKKVIENQYVSVYEDDIHKYLVYRDGKIFQRRK